MTLERFNPVGIHPPQKDLYSHVVRSTGATYRIGGMVALDGAGETILEGDMAGQVRHVYDQVGICLRSQGLAWSNVTHLYIFTTDMDAYVAVEQEVVEPLFGDTPPAATLVEVTRLVNERWLVEVQADAAE